ncbi:hypothetical protein V2J09_002503 [Rumex salicifolius]
MPGTVQVSILELKGLPSSKSSSSMIIKVSLGKHTYEAEGQKGDFLFPLATFRDTLVVKVHDNKGNEIAHTGVKSRLIAEKGHLDDEFPLEGGGHIHMKLKFSLSEDERNRIRNMRETALRKKKEELLNKSLQAVVASSGGGNEMPSTAAIDLPLEASSKVVNFKSSSKPINTSPYSLKEQIPQEKTLSKLKEDEQLNSFKKQIPLEETSPIKLKEDNQPYKLREQSPVNLKDQSALEKTPTKLKEDDQLYKLKEQSLIKEIPSKLQEDDQPYSVKEQSKMDETPRKLQEDDQTCNLKDQSPLEKKPCKLQEDDQPYNMKEESLLEKTVSKLQEDDQSYKCKEQSPLEETSRKFQKDDQPYNSKEQIPFEKTPSKANKGDRRYNIEYQSPLKATPSKAKDDDQRHNLKKPSLLEATPSKVKDNDQCYNLKEQTPLERTPSRVRETIAVFETSRLTKGRKNAAKAQPGREQPTSILDETEPIETKYVDNVEYKSKDILVEKEPKEKYSLHNIAESEEKMSSNELSQPSDFEQYNISRVDHDYLSDETQPSISVTEQRMDAEVCGRRRRCSCNNFHGWIFLEETVCTCIVSDNRMVINLLEGYNVDTKTYPGKIVDEEVTSSEDDKLPDVATQPESGPHGQIMKIVIMVGFGLLMMDDPRESCLYTNSVSSANKQFLTTLVSS